MAESFPPDKWFEKLFGFAENWRDLSQFKCTPQGAAQEHPHNKKIGHPWAGVLETRGGTYGAGQFLLRTIRDIKRDGLLDKVGGGKLTILHPKAEGSDVTQLRVPAAIARPENDGAMWLIASNFNCLEYVNANQKAEHGVTGYVSDRTQGPYASLACGAALVYRNYFMPHTCRGTPAQGQLQGREVNLLEHTPLGKYVRGGYCEIPTPEAAKEVLAGLKGVEDDLFQVGVHSFCEITTTQEAGGKFAKVESGRICHQIFAAALNFAGSVVPCYESEQLGMALLEAEYRACVYTAWELFTHVRRERKVRPGSHKLFLTLLGGGVFANSIESICWAIAKCKDLIVDSGLHVFVVTLGGDMGIAPEVLQVAADTGGWEQAV